MNFVCDFQINSIHKKQFKDCQKVKRSLSKSSLMKFYQAIPQLMSASGNKGEPKGQETLMNWINVMLDLNATLTCNFLKVLDGVHFIERNDDEEGTHRSEERKENEEEIMRQEEEFRGEVLEREVELRWRSHRKKRLVGLKKI